jgi:hypothetical protein
MHSSAVKEYCCGTYSTTHMSFKVPAISISIAASTERILGEHLTGHRKETLEAPSTTSSSTSVGSAPFAAVVGATYSSSSVVLAEHSMVLDEVTAIIYDTADGQT